MSIHHERSSLSRSANARGAFTASSLLLAAGLSGCFVVDASLYEALPTGADLGAPDLGPPDLGPPDLGPPDLGTDAGPPRTGLCPPSLSCVAFPLGEPDAGTMVRFATNPGLCQ